MITEQPQVQAHAAAPGSRADKAVRKIYLPKSEAVILRSALNHYVAEIPVCLLSEQVQRIFIKLESIIGTEF